MNFFNTIRQIHTSKKQDECKEEHIDKYQWYPNIGYYDMEDMLIVPAMHYRKLNRDKTYYGGDVMYYYVGNKMMCSGVSVFYNNMELWR